MINRPYVSQKFKKKKIIFTFLGVFLILLDFYFLVKNPVFVVYVFFLVILIYLSSFLLSCISHKRKSKFKCLMCGECCKPKVHVTELEIKTIEKLGFKRKDFMKGIKVLKRVNGYCVFLKNKNDKKVCSIYKHRPSICRKWPFFSYSSIIPLHWFFKCPSLKNLILNKSSG